MKKKFKVWLLLIAVITFAGCSKDHTRASNTFMLVHGAWQAPYVWDTVKAELEKAGQKVIVVELPAHGDDFTSPANVTIDGYRDTTGLTAPATNSILFCYPFSTPWCFLIFTANRIR